MQKTLAQKKKSNLTTLKSVTFVYQNNSLKVKRQVTIWERQSTIYTPKQSSYQQYLKNFYKSMIA